MEDTKEDILSTILVMLSCIEEEKKEMLSDYFQVISGTSIFSGNPYYNQLLASIHTTFAPFFSEVQIEYCVFDVISDYLKEQSHISVEIQEYIEHLLDGFDELFIRRTLAYKYVLEFYVVLIYNGVLTDLNYHVKGLNVTLTKDCIEEVKHKLKNT